MSPYSTRTSTFPSWGLRHCLLHTYYYKVNQRLFQIALTELVITAMWTNLKGYWVEGYQLLENTFESKSEEYSEFMSRWVRSMLASLQTEASILILEKPLHLWHVNICISWWWKKTLSFIPFTNFSLSLSQISLSNSICDFQVLFIPANYFNYCL